IMSQVTEQSVRFQTALASIKLIQASAVLDLTEDDFDFRSEERFSRNAETDLVCRLLLEKKNPDEAVHVHHHRVLTCGQDLSIRPLCLISRVEQELIYVRDAALGCDPGVGCAHAKRVNTSHLGQGGHSDYADGSQQTKWHGTLTGKTSRHKPRRAPSTADCSKDGSFEGSLLRLLAS